MSTRRQRAASRANAQKSTGPTSPEGKAKSRFNALKHGIDAKQQVMFSESAEDLAELAAEFHELCSPANADERFLVDTIINNEWRLRRLRCVEAELWRAATKLFLESHETTAAGPGDGFTGSGPPSNAFSESSIPVSATFTAPAKNSRQPKPRETLRKVPSNPRKAELLPSPRLRSALTRNALPRWSQKPPPVPRRPRRQPPISSSSLLWRWPRRDARVVQIIDASFEADFAANPGAPVR